jgi:hypothetical protein
MSHHESRTHSFFLLIHSRKTTLMSQQRRTNEDPSDEDELNNRNPMERRSSLDGLELVPTLLKIKQIVLLRHSDFLRLLNEFNSTLEMFTTNEPHFLHFTVVPNSDSNIFWKALIRITCSKVC